MTAINWTPQQQLMALMRLPWSIHIEHDELDGSWIAEVAEIPDAIATGNSVKELAKDLWESLAASLEIRLEHGDMIPLPPGSVLPWNAKAPRRVERVEVRFTHRVGDLIIEPRATETAA